MKIFTGKVISKKMAKTATVAVERTVVHPVYKKRIRRIKKYHVHDVLGTKVGQTVQFVASKPYSKSKRWKIAPAFAKATAGKEVSKVGKVPKVSKARKIVKKKLKTKN